MKNPFNSRYKTINEIVHSDSRSCLEESNGQIALKRSHKYNAQVPCEMYVSGCKYGHFVLRTCAKSDNIFMEHIDIHDEFVTSMIKKCLIVYRRVMVPELFNQAVHHASNVKFIDRLVDGILDSVMSAVEQTTDCLTAAPLMQVNTEPSLNTCHSVPLQQSASIEGPSFPMQQSASTEDSSVALQQSASTEGSSVAVRSSVAVQQSASTEGSSIAVQQSASTEGSSVAVRSSVAVQQSASTEGSSVAVQQSASTEGSSVAVQQSASTEGSSVAVQQSASTEGSSVAVQQSASTEDSSVAVQQSAST